MDKNTNSAPSPSTAPTDRIVPALLSAPAWETWNYPQQDVSSAAPIAEGERAAFEAWVKTCPSHPFAGVFLNLMWDAWQARAAKPAAREAARQSIAENNKFHELLADHTRAACLKTSAKKEKAALIAHIDTWGGAAEQKRDSKG